MQGLYEQAEWVTRTFAKRGAYVFERLAISEVFIIRPQRFGDARGYFSETFRQRWFDDAAIDITFRQDNHAYSAERGTLRGLHFQLGPSVQAKLVRCLRGAILDVAVDIRKGSPTFGQHVAAELTAEEGNQIFVPHGFAHAYLTLSEDTEVAYKVDNYYDQARESALRFDDPALGIDWPIAGDDLNISDKDRAASLLADLPDYFIYDETRPFNVKCRDIG